MTNGTHFVALDQASGEMMVYSSTDNGGIVGAGIGLISREFEAAVSIGGAFVGGQLVPRRVVSQLVARHAVDMFEQAKRFHSQNRLGILNAKMEVVGTHNVSPLQYIRVDYFTAAGRVHYYSGVYQVDTVEHNVDSSGWKTTFTMRRQGGFTNQMNVSGQPGLYQPSRAETLPETYY